MFFIRLWVFFFFLITHPVTAQQNAAVQTQVPELLNGLWDGSDRCVVFSENSDEKKPADVAIILKTLYGWYYDRTVEPASYAAERTVNSVTVQGAEQLTALFRQLPVTYRTLAQYRGSGAWEIVIQYDRRTEIPIPVAVIGNSLYLDFVIRDVPAAGSSDSTGSVSSPAAVSQVPGSDRTYPPSGFWQGVGTASGIKVSPPVISSNLTSLFMTGGAVYRIRYWTTDMEYEGDTPVNFYDQTETYRVAGHITSAGQTYTCVTGRGRTIRNVKKLSKALSDYTLDSTRTICAFGPPYLTRSGTPASVENVIQLVAKANSRRKPDPPPLFPPEKLDWHLDEINQLDSDDPLIQAVRQHQKEFELQHTNNASR